MSGLAVIAVGAFILLVATDTVPPEVLPGDILGAELTTMAGESGAALWTYIGVAIALIVAGVIVFGLELRQLIRAATLGMAMLSSDPEGTVRVSVDSVRELAERTVQGNRSVRRIRCGVQVTGQGLRIRCAVGLSMGTDVPAKSSSIQRDVREVVERLIGLPVLDVPVRARYLKDREQAVLVR